MGRVLVPFEGAGHGVGELSWGQQEIWRAIRRYGNSLSLGGVIPLPDGTTVEDVAASLAFLVGRHESLRTRLSIDKHGHARTAAVLLAAYVVAPARVTGRNPSVARVVDVAGVGFDHAVARAARGSMSA